MTGSPELAGVGKADHCELAKVHKPVPLRFVFHHILPLEAGGKTEPGNLEQVCDSCHYSVHILLWYLANGGIPPTVKGTRTQLTLAQRGYAAAMAAGTEGKIPKEA